MKEYEKLANEFEPRGDFNCEDDIEDAFIGGFLKAREMALEIVDKNSKSYCYDYLEKMGEKEV